MPRNPNTLTAPPTARIFDSMRQALLRAATKGNEASFDVIINGIKEAITMARAKERAEEFRHFLCLLKEPYASLHPLSGSKGQQRIADFYRESLTLYVRWLLYYILEDSSAATTKSAMFRSIFSFFSDYLFANIHFGDTETLKYTYNELMQVRQDLHRRVPSNLNPKIENVAYRLQQDWSDLGDVNHHFAMLMTAANYWTIFLYDEKEIPLQQLEKFQEILVLPNFSFDTYFPQAIHFHEGLHPGPLRTWHNWDHKERMSGVVYTPPQPIEWATWGFVVQLVKSTAVFSGNFHNYDSRVVELLLDDLLQHLETLKAEGYELYHKYFGVPNQENFNKRIQPYIEQIKLLRKKSDDEKLQSIAQLPISPRIVRSFTNLFVKGYRDASDILTFFDHLGVVKKVSRKDNLKLIGVKDRFWLSGKHHFIDRGEFNIPVFSMEQFGRELAYNFESDFLTEIQGGHTIHVTHDRVAGMKQQIDEMHTAGYTPTVIIMGYDSWSSLLSYEPPPGYIAAPGTEEGKKLHIAGRFYNIPVIRSRSTRLSGIIMIADVEKAFEIELFADENLPYRDVITDIREISAATVDEVFNKAPDYYRKVSGSGEDMDKAKIFIRNAVYFDLYILLKYRILDGKAYRFIGQGAPR